jgi:hypothetical protein
MENKTETHLTIDQLKEYKVKEDAVFSLGLDIVQQIAISSEFGIMAVKERSFGIIH